MLGLVLPVICAAALVIFTLVISFLSIEMVLRVIGKGLGVEAQSIRRPINSPV